MKTTRILPLVLVCIVAFGAASTIGFALRSNTTEMIETTVPKGTFDVYRYAETVAKNIRIRGDPINDPKPN